MAIDVPADHSSPTPHSARLRTDDGNRIPSAPTHLLTLIRTTKEISDLHAKVCWFFKL